MSLQLAPGDPPANLEFDETAGAVVTNYGPGTVSYADNQDVRTAADGTIASGSTATLTGSQWFSVTVAASISWRPLPVESSSGGAGSGAPAGPPSVGTGAQHYSPMWNPDTRRPVAEADTLFLLDVQTEADVLAQGGRLNDVYDSYLIQRYTTALAGTNNDLVYTVQPGAAASTIAYVVAGASTPLTISVTGTAITVNVATNGSSVATSTAAQVAAAVKADAAANALVQVANAPSNDGTGVVTALAATTVGMRKAPLVTGPSASKAVGQSVGTTDHLIFPLDGLLPTDQFTIEFRLKPKGSDLASIAGAKTFLSFACFSSGADSLKVVAQSGPALRAQMQVDGANYFANDLIISVGDHPADTWKTYTVTFDGTNLTMRLGNATKTSSGNVHGANPAPAAQYRPYGSVDNGGSGLFINGAISLASAAVEVGDVHVRRWARTPNASTIYKGPTVTVNPSVNVSGAAVSDVTGVFAQYPGWRDGIRADGSIGGGGVTPTSIRDQLIAAETAGGLKVVRIDHILDKVTITDNGVGQVPRYSYDWSNLDGPMDAMHAAGCDFHITLGFCPTLLSGGTNNQATPPTDNALFAQMCSDAMAHFITAKGYRIRTLALWNEPDVSTAFWTGTFAQYAAMWVAVNAKLLADWPTYGLGGPDTGWNNTGYIHQFLDYVGTNAITIRGPLCHHDYSGSLWQHRYDIKSMRDYAVTKGQSPTIPVAITEWNTSNSILAQYTGLDTSLAVLREPTNDEKFVGYAFAFVCEMLNAGVTLATFTRMGVLDNFYSYQEQFLGLMTSDDPPRPLPVYAAFQAMWKLQGQRVTATSNWPSVRALATKTAGGTITVALGTYRPWKEGDKINVAIEYGALPAAYTWEMWRWDKRNKQDGRLVLLAAGDETNLPMGADLHMFGVACVQITPA